MAISSDTPSPSYSGGGPLANQTNTTPSQSSSSSTSSPASDSVTAASFPPPPASQSISNNPQAPLLSKYVKTIIDSSQELQRLFNQMDVNNSLSEKALKQYLNEMAVLLRDSLPPSRHPLGSNLSTAPQPPSTQTPTGPASQPPPLTPPSTTPPPPIDPYYQQRLGSDKQLESLQELREQALSAGRGANLFKLINLQFNLFAEENAEKSSKSKDSKQAKKEKDAETIKGATKETKTAESAITKKDEPSAKRESIENRQQKSEKQGKEGVQEQQHLAQNTLKAANKKFSSEKENVQLSEAEKKPLREVETAPKTNQAAETTAFQADSFDASKPQPSLDSVPSQQESGSDKVSKRQEKSFSFEDPAIQGLLAQQKPARKEGVAPIPPELHEKAVMAGKMQTLMLISLAGFSASKEALHYSFSPAIINTPEGQHQVRAAVSVGFAKQLISLFSPALEDTQRKNAQQDDAKIETSSKAITEKSSLRASIESLVESDSALTGLDQEQKSQLADEIEANARNSFVKIAVSSLQGSLEMPELPKLFIDVVKEQIRAPLSRAENETIKQEPASFASSDRQQIERRAAEEGSAVKSTIVDNPRKADIATENVEVSNWTPISDERSHRIAEKIIEKALNRPSGSVPSDQKQKAARQTPFVLDNVIEERQVKEPIGFFKAMVEELSSRGVARSQAEKSTASLLYLAFLSKETNAGQSDQPIDPSLKKAAQHLLLTGAKEAVNGQNSNSLSAHQDLASTLQQEVQKFDLPQRQADDLTEKLLSFLKPSEADAASQFAFASQKNQNGEQQKTQFKTEEAEKPLQNEAEPSADAQPQTAESQQQLISSIKQKINDSFGPSMAPRQLEKLQQEILDLLLPASANPSPQSKQVNRQEDNQAELKQVNSLPNLLIRDIQHNKILQRDQSVIEKQEKQLTENFHEFMSQHIELAKWAEKVTDPATALAMAYSLTNKGIFRESGSDSKIAIGA